MENMHESVVKMWNEFVFESKIDPNSQYLAWHFCNDELSANHLAELVKAGRKTATSSLHCLYEIEGEPLPKVGDYSVITDWDGIAQCIICTSDINIIPFRDVNDDFAKLEGEGDLSLDYWQDVHIKFFNEELNALGRTFSSNMFVVCEVFKVVFPV